MESKSNRKEYVIVNQDNKKFLSVNNLFTDEERLILYTTEEHGKWLVEQFGKEGNYNVTLEKKTKEMAR